MLFSLDTLRIVFDKLLLFSFCLMLKKFNLNKNKLKNYLEIFFEVLLQEELLRESVELDDKDLEDDEDLDDELFEYF